MTTYQPPGAGAWKRDDVHITTVLTGYFEDMVLASRNVGFTEGFAYYGAMLAGFDTYMIAGREYMRPRIAGAPPQPIWGDKPPAKLKGPGKPPPKLIFKLLFALHPELRRRARRSKEVWDQKVWREMTRRWFDDLRPQMFAKSLELTRVDLAKLDDEALAKHVDAVANAFCEMFIQHFRHSPMPAVVVGDFMVRVMEWTGASPSEVLALLQGASPASRAGADETRKIAAALERAPALLAVVESERPAAVVVAALRADTGEVGRATNDYLDIYGLRAITGLDLYHQALVDLPDLFVRGLRAALGKQEAVATQADSLAAALRARTPEAKRAEFDAAYAEARLAYSVRDDDVGIVMWRMGLVSRAVNEAARRLAKRGVVHEAAHALDAKPPELLALLRGQSGPSADELQKRTERRAELDAIDPPLELGEAGAMPAEDCFPPAVVRTQRAVMAFMRAMNGDRKGGKTGVQGTGVSTGVYEGRARLVRGAADFARIEAGDVLIARATTPAYNVLLPLIGAVVTERGGLLSHAAIVAREYGIPGVVDTRNALELIPDGARVRVDGKSGVVEIIGAAEVSTGSTTASTTTRATAAPVIPTPTPATDGRIVSLGAATANDFGGKAKALAAAIDAKLPVPDGLAIDADLVERVVANDTAARERVRAACAKLPGPWAVRSSAVGEDSAQASFAGQHSTLLGVKPDALFDAIAAVYASGHTESARAYRNRMGVAGVPRMGVVVQTLLRPDISGVLFSRDPTAAREGRVIEATWGLGEALVSGLVTPDRYRVGTDGKVLERAIGDKDIAIEAREGGGTAEIAIGGVRAKTACLDDARLAELAQLATRCEQLFGGPQDLEWAVANGRLHLLQSRPVTTAVRS